jgi:hypothetical protein
MDMDMMMWLARSVQRELVPICPREEARFSHGTWRLALAWERFGRSLILGGARSRWRDIDSDVDGEALEWVRRRRGEYADTVRCGATRDAKEVDRL